MGMTIPVVITVYADRTFTFITKTPPAPVLLLKAAGVAKGSGSPNKDKVGKVTEAQIMDIAKQKMPDMNAASVEAAAKDHPRHGAFDGFGCCRLSFESRYCGRPGIPPAFCFSPHTLRRQDHFPENLL